jgi:hypothetical protein
MKLSGAFAFENYLPLYPTCVVSPEFIQVDGVDVWAKV